MAQPVHRCAYGDTIFGEQAHHPPVLAAFHDFSVQLTPGVSEHDLRARLHARSWADERQPALAREIACSIIEPRHQQALDRSATRQASAEQPRGEHARVVQHEQIVWCEQPGEVSKRPVRDDASRSPKMHQARCPSGWRRLLRNQFRRQFEVEV